MSKKRHWKALRDESPPAAVASPKAKRLSPMTANQTLYLAVMSEKKATVCIGPAGTGKTFLSCWYAVQMLRAGDIEKVVLSRPLQECGKPIGFLPGDLMGKVGGMMAPLLDSLDEFLEPGELDKMLADGRITIVPLELMRGRTIKNAMVILDEAQNADFRQLRMFLTRFGSKAKMVICGDVTQSDLPYTGRNSLDDMVARFKTGLHPAVGIVEMGSQDVVRDELVAWFDEVMTRVIPKRRVASTA